MNDNLKIAGNFSRCAKLYDSYCGLQNKAAADLIDLIRGRDFYDILEIGCGTGNYTQMLRQEFRCARIEAFDIASGMVEVARSKLKDRDIDFKVADAHLLNKEKSFDLVTSNACFQWLNSLEKVLSGYNTMLHSAGVILFSTFGPRTFCELSASLGRVLEKSQISSSNFYDSLSIEKILKENFKSVSVKEAIYRENFENLKMFLETIKNSGTRGQGMEKVFFNRKILNDLEQIYLEEFGKISVTYQIFYCYGEKR